MALQMAHLVHLVLGIPLAVGAPTEHLSGHLFSVHSEFPLSSPFHQFSNWVLSRFLPSWPAH